MELTASYFMVIRDPRGEVIATSHITPAVADILPEVVTMPHAYDALDYVHSYGDDGPSCGCGGMHWSCPGNDEENDPPMTQSDDLRVIRKYDDDDPPDRREWL